MGEPQKAGAAATKDDMDLVGLHLVGKPPELEPVQECHFCHRGTLEKRTILGVFAYYACTNEEGCCLMFWRKPRNPKDYRRPADDEMEH